MLRRPVTLSHSTHAPAPSSPPKAQLSLRNFTLLALVIISLGIIRSAVATRLDSFTIDEAYHIAAGVTYVRDADFRVNPEHPPLVKLWVGSVLAVTGFNLKPLRQFSDKPDERGFAQDLVYRANDPDSVQRRTRAAMWTLNGLLLLALAFALRREFNSLVGLATLLVLVVDPTIAAHMPVVMTDLPVALLSATALVFAARAFQSWRWSDVAACSAFVGLALTAKHSAPIVLIIVLIVGTCAAIIRPASAAGATRVNRLAKVAVIAAGALAILWSAYFFRYSETPSGQESFNRALADKIEDVDNPRYHAVLQIMNATRIVPRAYLWGFADTVHAGMEGRLSPQLFFGRIYFLKGPKYFFPAVIAVKLPIGSLTLILLGIAIVLARRLPSEWKFPSTLLLVAVALFFLVLASGATYAGVRHALPVVVLLYVFAGLAIERTYASRSRALQAAVALAFVAACASALPMLRPWEYFNEFIGPANAYKYFSDEGVDLGQRTKELAAYYRNVLAPAGEIPDIAYWSWSEELKARNVDYLGRDEKRDEQDVSSVHRTHPILTGTSFLKMPLFPVTPLISREPAARFGNFIVYRGPLEIPGEAAEDLYYHGVHKFYAEKPDEAGAERAWRRSLELAPTAFFIHIELGNLELKRGEREAALASYRAALRARPTSPPSANPSKIRSTHSQIPLPPMCRHSEIPSSNNAQPFTPSSAPESIPQTSANAPPSLRARPSRNPHTQTPVPSSSPSTQISRPSAAASPATPRPAPHAAASSSPKCPAPTPPSRPSHPPAAPPSPPDPPGKNETPRPPAPGASQTSSPASAYRR